MQTATSTTDMSKVLIGMSGGVDSSVAAALLKKDGHDVTGVTLILNDGETSFVNDAKAVCKVLRIPHIVVDLSREFKAYVKDAFVEEFRLGRTPNPCIACNRYVKWEALLQRIYRL